MKYEIWYMKPDHFSSGITGDGANKDDLSQTHILLRTIVVESWSLEKVFAEMQAENWSPNGEARALIESKGLLHTSMSVGDIVVQDGEAYVCQAIGFRKL